MISEQPEIQNQEVVELFEQIQIQKKQPYTKQPDTKQSDTKQMIQNKWGTDEPIVQQYPILSGSLNRNYLSTSSTWK